MPIGKFLEGRAFDPETIESMSQALVATCQALGLRATDDAATRRLAMRIIELARDGERDPERLKNAALRSLKN